MSPKILFALTSREWETFFPQQMRDEIISLGSETKIVDPEAMSTSEWNSLLSEFQPQVLVAAWKTPAIPDDYESLTGGQLSYICYLAGSVRKLVKQEYLENGLRVTNWGNVISRVVAECGLMLAIASLRQAGHWQLAMHNEGGWKSNETVTGSLFEKRIGIHGFGRITQELVRLLAPFRNQISSYSPHVPDQFFEEFNVHRVHSLETLFAENEVIFELAALTPENEGVVTESHLRMIPKGGAFINIGRGAVVDEEALARVAAEGNIQVGLDVYGEEPLPKDSPFRGMRNVVLLPHLGGPTTDRRIDSGRLAIANIKKYINGDDLDAEINPLAYSRST